MANLNLVATVAYSSVETVYQTYKLTKEVANIEGILVECGVAAGAQLMAMSLADTGKQIIGFDSFEGIPLACEHDDEQPGIGAFEVQAERLVSSGITSHSVENVLGNFDQIGVKKTNLKLIKGWFQHTLPEFKKTPIALLRLDGDLYESTKVCLELLYPMVSKGGIVIIDDYALGGCRKAVHEYFGKDLPDIIGESVVYFYKK